MSKGRGYLLPANLEPETERCIIVYVPNEQEYIDAFWGSLDYLSTWMAWEKNAEKTARVAAARWKRANIRTFDANLVLDCELLDELLEDGDMSITVNNNVSCGQCGTSHAPGVCTPTIAPNPEIHGEDFPYDDIGDLPTQEDPVFTFPTGWDSRAEYLAHKCKAADVLAFDILETLGNMQTIGALAGLVGVAVLSAMLSSTTLLATVAAPLVLIGFSGIAAVSIVIAAIVMLAAYSFGAFAYFGALHAIVLAQLDELRCALYLAKTTEEARQATIEMIGDMAGGIVYDNAADENMFQIALDSILTAMLPTGTFKVLFATLASIDQYLDSRESTFDCEGECGEFSFLSGLFFRRPPEAPLARNLLDHATGESVMGTEMEYFRSYRLTGDGAHAFIFCLSTTDVGTSDKNTVLLRILEGVARAACTDGSSEIFQADLGEDIVVQYTTKASFNEAIPIVVTADMFKSQCCEVGPENGGSGAGWVFWFEPV